VHQPALAKLRKWIQRLGLHRNPRSTLHGALQMQSVENTCHQQSVSEFRRGDRVRFHKFIARFPTQAHCRQGNGSLSIGTPNYRCSLSSPASAQSQFQADYQKNNHITLNKKESNVPSSNLGHCQMNGESSHTHHNNPKRRSTTESHFAWDGAMHHHQTNQTKILH